MTAILGAGVSGLSAAYYALQNTKMVPIVVFEATNRVGGWLRSTELADGTIFEQGPRTIRNTSNKSSETTLELIEQLQLSDKIIPISRIHPAARRRYIYANGQIQLMPIGIKNLFMKSSLLNRSIFNVIWKEMKIPRELKEDESVYSFTARRLGEDVADKMFCSIISGIFAGDAHNISAKSFMTEMFEAEQKYGSIFKGLMNNVFSRKKNSTSVNGKPNSTQAGLIQKADKEKWVMWSIKDGIEQLPQTLAHNIIDHGVNIKMQHKCEQLKFNKDSVEITVNGEIQKYSCVISSLPANTLANLVQNQHPELSNELKGIPTVTVGVVNLQFSENVLPVRAFGMLIRPKEERPILGVIFDSHIIPQKSNATVLTVMMGGAWFEKYFGQCSSKEHLLSVALDQIREILHITETPKASNVSILKDCIPQHLVGHMQRLTRIHNYISTHKIPLGLCGSSYQGVGINDVILSAKQAVSFIDAHI